MFNASGVCMNTCDAQDVSVDYLSVLSVQHAKERIMETQLRAW